MIALTRAEPAGIVGLLFTTVGMRCCARMSTAVLEGLSIGFSLVEPVRPAFPKAGGA